MLRHIHLVILPEDCLMVVMTMIQVNAIIKGKQTRRSGECGSVKPTAKTMIVNSSNSSNAGCGRRLMSGGANGQGGLRRVWYYHCIFFFWKGM